ncbi:MAG: hypothetical protein GX438_09585 [Treponema sp.]|nr:hypothetical protein [Treponema sp.]
MASSTRILKLLYPIFAAVVMVILVRSGLLTPLFLIPLGLLGQRGTRKEVIFTALLMIFINMAFSFFAVRSDPAAMKLFLADTLYVSALTLLFMLLLVPGVFDSFLPFLRGTYRVLLAAFIGMLFLLPIILFAMNDQGVYALFKEQADMVANMLKENAAGDAVQQSIIENSIDADTLFAIMKAVALRGGLFISHVIFFGVSAALSRQSIQHRWSLKAFHVDFGWIWVLSLMLLAILGGFVFSIEPLEILGWNGALTAILLYFLQGMGIISHYIDHPRLSRGNRFVLRTMLLVLLLSPGINAVVLAGLCLLGIAENWVSLRKPHLTGPSSTPGM